MTDHALESTTTFDSATFRDVLGHYPTGVALVTGMSADGEPVGMIVGSFTSVSLTPPLVAFLPAVSSTTFSRLRTAQSICINVLASDQEDLCRAFARKGGDKFAGVEWRPSASGAPIIAGAVASIDCTIAAVTEYGDHYLVVGAVVDLEIQRPVAPLVFFQGGYGRFALLSLRAHAAPDLLEAASLSEHAAPHVRSLATMLDAECAVMAASGDDVTVLASAVGPTKTPASRLGSRTPLMPPLGEVFVAFGESGAIDKWLGRAASSDQCSRERYIERLDVTRERGWSGSVAGPYRDREFFKAAREYSEDGLTPARQRHIGDVIAQASADHEPIEFVDGQRYDIGGLVAPVFDHAGKVRFVMRLTQLPQAVLAIDVQEWIDLLLSTARNVSELIQESANQ